MRERLVSVYLRLMKYAMLMGVLGGIASFIEPPHHGLIKAYIGVTIGAMLLGNRLTLALKDLWNIINETSDDKFAE